MKKVILFGAACLFLAMGFLIWQVDPKLTLWRNVVVASSVTDQMLLENAERIKQALAICEMDDDQKAFAQKAYNMLNDHAQWHMKNRDILKENFELLQKIDEQWMDAIYQLGLSLRNDSNPLRQEKKVAAIQLIASQLSKSNQEVLEVYVKNRMQQDGIAVVTQVQ